MSKKGRQQIDAYIENGVTSYREAIDCMMGIMVEYELALHPITAMYVCPPEHPSLPKQLSNVWIERLGWRKILQIDETLIDCYRIVRDNGIHPESFVTLFGSRLFANICVANYGRNQQEVERLQGRPISVPHRLLVPYDEDTNLEQMVLDLAIIDAQRTVQQFGMCGVQGFDLDGRGFLVLDAQKAPEDMNGFIEFLAENVEEMQGVKAVWDAENGDSKEELIDMSIQAIMDEDDGRWMDREGDKEMDPDSDDNDDGVVRW